MWNSHFQFSPEEFTQTNSFSNLHHPETKQPRIFIWINPPWSASISWSIRGVGQSSTPVKNSVAFGTAGDVLALKNMLAFTINKSGWWRARTRKARGDHSKAEVSRHISYIQQLDQITSHITQCSPLFMYIWWHSFTFTYILSAASGKNPGLCFPTPIDRYICIPLLSGGALGMTTLAGITFFGKTSEHWREKLQGVLAHKNLACVFNSKSAPSCC